MSETTALRLDWCSHEAARYACEKWHYSRSMPTPPLVKVGAWEGGRFVGCVVFSRGASDGIGKPYGLPQTAVAELTRVALTAHRVPTSRVVAVSLRLLVRRAPGLRLLVSFADPERGHVGGLYQAGNWVYAGQSEATTEYIGPDGRRWHGRMVSARGIKKVYGHYRRVLRPDQCRPVIRPGKHKYLMPLDAEMRARILPLARPYPKKNDDRLGRPRLESEASAIPGGHEGAAMRPGGSSHVKCG